MRVDVYVHFDSAQNGKLDEILAYLKSIKQMEEKMANVLDDLEAEAKANTDAEQAAVVLLGKLHDLLVQAQNDPVRLQKVINDLGASKDALAAAIVANTV